MNDPVAQLREVSRLMRERAQAARDLTEDGNGQWFPWGVIRQTAWREWPEPRPVPVPFASDGSTEMATGAHEPTGQAYVAHARYAHDREEDWHEAEFIAGPMPEPVAAFMAAMHPAVGLALADWLDRATEQADAELYEATTDAPCCGTPGACTGHPGILTCNRCAEPFPDYCHCWDLPLGVARAYLGTAEATDAR